MLVLRRGITSSVERRLTRSHVMPELHVQHATDDAMYVEKSARACLIGS
jgi:hypothetical protein